MAPDCLGECEPGGQKLDADLGQGSPSLTPSPRILENDFSPKPLASFGVSVKLPPDETLDLQAPPHPGVPA